jgi:hypothetical protein
VALRLVPTTAYQTARDALSHNARVTLRLVEEAIAEDPDHREHRHLRVDGNVVAYSASGLLVAFRRLDALRVELIEVIDLRDAPRWPR